MLAASVCDDWWTKKRYVPSETDVDEQPALFISQD